MPKTLLCCPIMVDEPLSRCGMPSWRERRGLIWSIAASIGCSMVMATRVGYGIVHPGKVP
ncbi:MAG: hypothetical protein ACNA8P_12790 [Phycisphaerales bacterium]